jgi:hypothetical protein
MTFWLKNKLQEARRRQSRRALKRLLLRLDKAVRKELRRQWRQAALEQKLAQLALHSSHQQMTVEMKEQLQETRVSWEAAAKKPLLPLYMTPQLEELQPPLTKVAEMLEDLTPATTTTLDS